MTATNEQDEQETDELTYNRRGYHETKPTKMNDQRKECDECGSEYYSSTSTMNQLCPECASILYGYDTCEHVFGEDKRCSRCYWDGSSSEYIERLKQAKS